MKFKCEFVGSKSQRAAKVHIECNNIHPRIVLLTVFSNSKYMPVSVALFNANFCRNI